MFTYLSESLLTSIFSYSIPTIYWLQDMTIDQAEIVLPHVSYKQWMEWMNHVPLQEELIYELMYNKDNDIQQWLLDHRANVELNRMVVYAPSKWISECSKMDSISFLEWATNFFQQRDGSHVHEHILTYLFTERSDIMTLDWWLVTFMYHPHPMVSEWMIKRASVWKRSVLDHVREAFSLRSDDTAVTFLISNPEYRHPHAWLENKNPRVISYVIDDLTQRVSSSTDPTLAYKRLPRQSTMNVLMRRPDPRLVAFFIQHPILIRDEFSLNPHDDAINYIMNHPEFICFDGWSANTNPRVVEFIKESWLDHAWNKEEVSQHPALIEFMMDHQDCIDELSWFRHKNKTVRTWMVSPPMQMVDFYKKYGCCYLAQTNEHQVREWVQDLS